MRIDILTLFPDYFTGPLTVSIVKRAVDKKALDLRITYLRDFAEGKRKTADDMPYGGGAGMVLKPEPLIKGIQRLKKGRKKVKVLLMSPQGKKLDHGLVMELLKEKSLLLVCGHYEGIDERVMDLVDEEISLGDFVLTGGEPAAVVLVDALARFLPGVVGDKESVEKDSFFNGLLDYPHYTRPHVFKGRKVPEVLLSGNHKNIERWRRKQSLRNTMMKRPDLLDRAVLNEEDRELIREIRKDDRP
jgi:tRNA (guanine37-N1)-methyltransferase